jgi:uncharacterized protein
MLPPSKSLVVSLHDVAPSTLPKVEKQIAQLQRIGVSRTSLLVVPSYHSDRDIRDDPEFCSRVRGLQGAGHEVVLHGFQHLIMEPTSVGDSRRWFYENLYTSREAEFLSLGSQAAEVRLRRGLEVFRDAGFGEKTPGFIAPAWLMNADVERSLKNMAFQYTNTIEEMVHLPSSARHPSRSCVWSVRAAWRRGCSRVWNRWLFQSVHSENELLRISLHPCDLDHPAIWRQIVGMTGKAVGEGRKPVTYFEWVDSRWGGEGH